MTLTVEPPVEALDAGVIEEARARQRLHRWMVAVAAAVAAAVIALILVLVLGGGGGSIASAGFVTPGQPLKLTFKNGLAYENGQPIVIGIAPDLSAGIVGLDVRVVGEGVAGGSYPTAAQPVFGPDANGFSVGNGRAGPGGEIDITLTGATAATMHVKGLGTFKPVRVLGLLPGERAFVFYRPPGALGTVLGPGIKPDVLQSFEKAKHEPAATETLYDAAGKLIPVTFGRGFHLPSSYWQEPATPVANGRCALSSTLAGVSTQWGEVATAIAPDNAVSGTAFLSCLHTWYTWHHSGFDVGVLLNAESPGRAPAPLWNSAPLSGHPGLVEVKPTQSEVKYRVPRLPSQPSAASVSRLATRLGKVRAAQEIQRYERTVRRENQHAGQARITWVVLAPGAVARRVGNAWLVVRDGNSLAQRIQFLNGLHITRLNLSHARNA